MTIPPGSAGKTLHVLAQWCNERGHPGPVGFIASVMLAA